MASRGGRGGGRGGRGGASGKPQMPIGHLQYAEIIEKSKEGTDVLYPPADMPDTADPTPREARIAARYNNMTSEMKFTPFWVDAPVKASTDIERYSDRFKMGRASADGTLTATLASLAESRKLDRSLLPSTAAEAIFDKKKRGRAGAVGRGSKRARTLKVSDALAGGEENAEGKEGEDSGSELEEDPDMLEEEEEEEDNDYEDNYFDNGEDDGGDADALGGGGDEDGGTF